MKIGIITDVHNNVIALQAVWGKFQEENCDGLICCGDFIGIGAYPEETVSTIRKIPNMLACVRGNHERYLIEGIPSKFPNSENMGLAEMEYHKWEHLRLSNQSVEYIRNLPYEKTITVCGKRIYAAHYCMNSNNEYINYVHNPTLNDLQKMFVNINADIIIYGHNHEENVFLWNIKH